MMFTTADYIKRIENMAQRAVIIACNVDMFTNENERRNLDMFITTIAKQIDHAEWHSANMLDPMMVNGKGETWVIRQYDSVRENYRLARKSFTFVRDTARIALDRSAALR